MRRALIYLALLAAATAGVLWFANLGGTVEIRVAGNEIILPFAIAVAAAAVGFLVLHLILVGIGALRRWPGRARARKEARRRAEGDAAVTRALVALAAGTPDVARVEVRRARDRLGDTPHTLMLAAEAERLAGREEAAAEAFRALADRPDARFIGLRGLLRQAIQREDWPTAQRLAREAEAAQPGAQWLRQERETLALRTRDWREALALAAPGTAQAPLALAAAQQEPNPDRAAELERQAFESDRGFTPAAMAHAERLKATGHPRRSKQVLEQSWAARPHPDVAEAYLAATEGDTAAKLRAVELLVGPNPKHPESRLLLARAALAAGQLPRARAELEALDAAASADRRAYLALSDLEEVEGGDNPDSRMAQGRWLRRAATAAPEPRWRCSACGTDHVAWTAACPKCQSVGTIGWTSPQQLPAAAQ